jgi:hypothetical protein
MNFEKIITHLESLKSELEEIKKSYNETNTSRLSDISSKISMIIRRVYPNHKEIEDKFFERGPKIYYDNDELFREYYASDCNQAIRAIDTIIEEFKLFGFDDFTPIKEKIETEYQVGSEKFGGFFRKKKTK